MRKKVNKKTMRKKQMRKKKMRKMKTIGENVITFVNDDMCYNVCTLLDKEKLGNMFNVEISNEQWEKFMEAEDGTLKISLDRFCAHFIFERLDKYFGGE